MANHTATTITLPSGWTQIQPAFITGTRRNFIFAKIKEGSDGNSVSFAFTTATTINFALLYGGGARSVASWIVGTPWSRETNSAEPTGARYNNVATGVTVTEADSLVVAISNEATLAQDQEHEVVSVSPSGWTENGWTPQIAVNDRIETVWFGSKEMSSSGASGDVTVTYLHPQNNNGFTLQLVLPPSALNVELEAPYVVSSSDGIGGSTGPSVTIPRPSGVQTGDMLVAVLRCQSSTAVQDWSTVESGWTRVGPAWPGASQSRLNTQFVKRVGVLADEPSSYVFTRTVNDANRRVGQIIALRSNTGVPDIQAWDPIYAGEDPAGSIDRAPHAYSVAPPVLELLWAGAEFASPNSHAMTAAPVNFTEVRYSTTSEDTGISRTILYTGTHTYTAATTTVPSGPDWAGTASGAAAGSLSFYSVPAHGDGLSGLDGNLGDVQLYHMTTQGPRTPLSIQKMRRGFSNVSEMLSTQGFTWAHRGGSSSWPEMSLYAYTQSVLRGYGVLEVSLGRTSDGVWFGLHDQSTDRTSGGTYGNASSQTWAQIQAQHIVVGGSGAPQPYMRWEEIVEAYGDTHILVADPKYALGSYRAEFLDLVESTIGTERAIIKYSGPGSGATSLSTQAQARGFETWGFFYASDASVSLGGNGSLQTWGPSWTLIGMEYGASQDIWNEALALGKPVIGHITPSQTHYNTAIAKGASGVQVSGVGLVEPVSWWTKPTYPSIVGVTTSSRTGPGSLTVTLPTEAGGCYMVMVVGDSAPVQPATPAGWTLVNWSTGNPDLNMGIYVAPSGTAAPTFTLSQDHDGGFVATALRFDVEEVVITGSGGNNTLSSTATTATKPSLVVWTLSAALSGPPPVNYTFPVAAPRWRTTVVSAGTEGGAALGLAGAIFPTAGAIPSMTWGLDNQWTTRAGGFIITLPDELN